MVIGNMHKPLQTIRPISACSQPHVEKPGGMLMQRNKKAVMKRKLKNNLMSIFRNKTKKLSSAQQLITNSDI